ncbi:MAG: glycerol-3-phosphate cytidylyltransferase [Flavobacteriaceae bacterium]
MNIYVLGAGSFGTAMANQLSSNPNNIVYLFCRDAAQEKEINQFHTNVKYFPNKELSKSLKATSKAKDLLRADIVFIALPSGEIQHSIDQFQNYIKETTLVVNLSKGIFKNGHTIVDFLKEKLGRNNVVTMKGPTFAVEIINNEHSLFTLGFRTKDQYHLIHDMVQNTNIHIDYTTDIRGVELLSALKNIYAIVIGIIDAKYNAVNTKHMVLTKAFSEIRVLLKSLGGKEDTLFLSCGYGDFGLTSLNDMSRNRALGLMIGKGFYTPEVKQSSVLVEGLKTIEFIFNTTPNFVKERTPIFNKVQSFFVNNEIKFDFDFNSLMNNKMKTVLTYGTFDLLHYGHVEILRRSKEMGDRLIVGLSTDEFNEVKGKTCEMPYKKRKELLEAIEYVDLVIPESHWDQKVNDVQEHEVDIFVMGDDWDGKFDFLKKHCEVRYLPRTHGISTTKLKSILNEGD